MKSFELKVILIILSLLASASWFLFFFFVVILNFKDFCNNPQSEGYCATSLYLGTPFSQLWFVYNMKFICFAVYIMFFVLLLILIVVVSNDYELNDKITPPDTSKTTWYLMWLRMVPCVKRLGCCKVTTNATSFLKTRIGDTHLKVTCT